jgi:integrase
MAKSFKKLSVEHMKPGKTRQEIADRESPGLYLIIQPTGSKSWAFRYRSREDGKVKKMTLGQFPAMSLGDAHKAAEAVRTLIANKVDPIAARAEQVAVDKGKLFETIAADFAKHHIEKLNKPGTQYEHKRMLNTDILPHWTGKNIEDIDLDHINRLLTAKLETGVTTSVNRIQSLICKLFKWAKQTGRIKYNVATDLPKLVKENARERVLSHEELRICWLAADRIGYPFGDVVKLLILTGQRSTEITRMSWEELNFAFLKGPIFTIPKERAKNGLKHIVPLAPAVAGIIRAVPQLQGSNWVFTHDGNLPVQASTKNKAKLDKIMKEIMAEEAAARGEQPKTITLEPWTLHDLRRTMGTHCVDDLHLPWEWIDVVHNHAKKGMAKHYNQAKYVDQKINVLNQWAGAVDRIVKRFPVKAIPMAA